MQYLLNNRTSKTLDYFAPPIVFNRKKPEKQLFAPSDCIQATS